MANGTPQFDGMPANVLEVFGALWQDVGNLDLNWKGFCQLYSKSPERIELLRRFGGLFFGQVQQALFRDILLRICHLTDPATSSKGRYKNQSLHRLLDEIGAHDLALIDTLGLKTKADQLTAACRDIRTLRNRAIAHRDWDARIRPLPSTTKEQMGNAIALIQEIMNTVEKHFVNRITWYAMERNPGDAEYLAERLEGLARRIDDERRAKGLPLSPGT